MIKDNISEKKRSLTGAITCVEGRPRVSVRLAVKLSGEMVKLPLRARAPAKSRFVQFVPRTRWPRSQVAARVWRRENAPGDQLGHFATLPGPCAARGC